MTLTDLHNDPVKLREYLGLRPGQCVETAWREYTHKTDTRKTQTHQQMIRECLREEFGLSRGSIDDRRWMLIAKYPKMYTAPVSDAVQPSAPAKPEPPQPVSLSGPDLVTEMKRRKVIVRVLAAHLGIPAKDVTAARRNGVPDGEPWVRALGTFPIPIQPAKKRSVIAKVAAAIVWLCLLILGEVGKG